MRRAGAVLSALVVLLACTVVAFGWVLEMDQFRRLDPDFPGMAISTALGLIGCGVSIFRMSAVPGRGGAETQTKVAFVLLGMAAANVVLLQVAGRGLDSVIIEFVGGSFDAYMAPATSIALALAAGCLLVPRRRGEVLNGDIYAFMAAAGLLITVLALTGYAFDSSSLRKVFFFSAMAFHTAIGFFAIFLALLLRRPTWGFMRIVIAPEPGSMALRRMLPYAIVGPFALCGLTLVAVRAEVFNANFRLSVLAIAGATCLIFILFRSAARQNAEAKTRAAANRRLWTALKDRDVLLKEVYHRVKNNLQFIDAMLALEANSLGDKALVGALTKIRTRVHALGLVHQQLIGSQDLATVNLQEFLRELCGHQAKGAGLEARNISIETRIDPLWVDLDRATPIGLLVTELLSNATKHAFPDGRTGKILVEAERTGRNALVVSVSDNGVGASEDNAGGNSPRQYGNMILTSLTEQLGATMVTENSVGYRVTLTIPLPREEKINP